MKVEKYGGEEMSLESNNNCFVKVGISRLVEEGTFNAAFPLHDVCYHFILDNLTKSKTI